jgi:hypothetical protein
MRNPILDFLSQLEASGEFVGGDGTHVCVAVMVKFDAKELLEDVMSMTGGEWWAEAVGR